MKKQIGLLLLLFVTCCQLFAGNRTEEQMKSIAANVLTTQTRRAANVAELKEFLSLSKLKIYGYEDGGFAVIPSDDRYESVIGVSAGTFDGPLPCGFKWWIEAVDQNMQNSESVGYEQISKFVIKISSSGVAPLLSSIWGQERPFNNYCTFTNNGKNYQCVTGCVATALAQIMNYHHFPISGTGSNSYDITYNNEFTITFAEDFSQSVYNWDSMLDDYSAYSNTTTDDIHTQAVAKLMKDCGVATGTRFSDSTHGSSSSIYDAFTALTTYFKYDSGLTKYYARSDYNRESWLSLIYDELDKGRPVFYSGKESESTNSKGHAFVLNGYDAEGKVYVNWGWDGRYNGYYDIDLLSPTTDNQYNYNQYLLVAVPGTDDTVLQTITINSTGAGSVAYGSADGAQIRNGSQSFKIKEGNSATIFFTSDIGSNIKSVKVNGADVTSSVSNNQYEVSNIQTTTTIDVEFDEASSSSTSDYNKYITCVGSALSKVQVGSLVTITLSFEITNSGNSSINIKKIVAKDPDTKDVLLTLTDTEANGELQANSSKSHSLTISKDISKYPEFDMEYTWEGNDYAYFSSQNCVLTIQSNDFGSIIFAGVSVGASAKKFSVETSGQATIEMVPNTECELIKLTVNNTDVTSEVSNNQYTIMNIVSNTSVKAVFESNSEDNPTVDGHEYVDLGLSSGKCWSVMNYGANKPEETGSYNSSTSDYVKSKWGDNWRKPTKDEFQELIDECEWTWTTLNEQNGFEIKGRNGKSMFLPAAGYKSIMGKSGVGTTAYYLTSTKEMIDTWILKATSTSKQMISTFITMEDYTIRPILNIIIEPKLYKLTYMVDNEVYKTYDLKSGEEITPEPAPTKEGYTFSGWSEIPEKMPAHDVTVTGSFTINKYKLIYQVDGVNYKTYELEYGATITPEPAPTKEGYTFSGWSEIPTTMPAQDVTITGTFNVNKYKLTYIVDDAEYKTYEIEYGATITPEPAPTKEGYTFSGWSEIPETMPAYDVTVTGTFSLITFQLTYIVDNEVYKVYELAPGTAITPEPAPTKEGYSFSGWSEIPEIMPAYDVTVTGSFIMIDPIVENITYVLTDEGLFVKSGENCSGSVAIPASVELYGQTYQVIGIGEGAFKGNTAITSVSIDNGIVQIGTSAFEGCSNLTEIVLGSDIVSIGEKAFANFASSSSVPRRADEYGLTVYSYPKSVPETAANAFENTPIDKALLLVYDEVINDYANAAPWSEFGTIQGFNGGTGIKSIWAGEGDNAKIYDLKGRRVVQPSKGLYIKNGKKYVVK